MWILWLALVSSLQLFFVPHSHCDPGWLQPIEWYYFKKVKGILDAILVYLQEQPEMKMVWSQTSYLKMWMDDQNQVKRDKMKDLIKKGQLQIVGGGYVQNDQASPDIELITRQIQTGHRYLHDEFGIERVRVGWQIDPFGLSAQSALMFAKFGFQYLVINRIDVNFRDQLIKNGDLEMVWKIGSQQIFIHNLYDHYDPPSVLHWGKSNCFRDKISNCSFKIYDLVKNRASAYKTDKIMLIYGDDFTFLSYEQIKDWLGRLKNIRDFINTSSEYSDLTVRLATASEYFDAVRSSQKTFKTYRGDFLQYQNMRKGTPVYWAGYYTTRPALKKLIYSSHDLARAAELAKAIVQKMPHVSPQCSFSLHHDAITGTCRQHVQDDYIKRLERENQQAVDAIQEIVNQVFTISSKQVEIDLPYRPVVLYNTLNWDNEEIMKIESKTQFLQIFDWNLQGVSSQSVPNRGKFDIYFRVKIPALSFVVVFVKEHQEPCERCSAFSTLSDSYQFFDQNYQVQMNPDGFLQSVTDLQGNTFSLNQQFHIYNGANGGAYIYYPIQPPQKIQFPLVEYSVYEGPIVTVAHSRWERSASQKNYQQKVVLTNTKQIKVEIGVYADRDEQVMLRFTNPQIQAQDWFYTSNSADLRQRKFFECNTERLGSNMYPIPGGLAVKGPKNFLKLFSKFSIGAGMRTSTSFELMLHRKLSTDDGFGLGTGVNDMTFVTHEFSLEFGELEYKEFVASNWKMKHSTIVFTASDQNWIGLTRKAWDSGEKWNKQWPYQTFYQFGKDQPSLYLSSAVVKDESLLFRVQNLQRKLSTMWIEGYSVGKKKFYDGYVDKKRFQDWDTRNQVVFNDKANSGYPLYSEGRKEDYDDLGEMEIATFQVQFGGVVKQEQEVVKQEQQVFYSTVSSGTFQNSQESQNIETSDQEVVQSNFSILIHQVKKEIQTVADTTSDDVKTLGLATFFVISAIFSVAVVLYFRSHKSRQD